MENLNKSFEPMDIDLSGQSASAMDISYNNSEFEIQAPELDQDCYIVSSSIRARAKSPVPSSSIASESPVPSKSIAPESPVPSKSIASKSPVPCFKPKSIPNRTKIYHIDVQSKSRKSCQERGLKILGFLFALFGSIVLYRSVFFCYKEPNLNHLRDTLSTQLFGQDGAIETIISALGADNTQKILFFYGGTGVGKTLTSSLIMDNIGPSSNLFHFTMPTFTERFSSDLMVGLNMCESTTIIVDDLSIDNNISDQINNVITKSDYLKRNLTIILIHNCAGTDNVFHKKCDESVQSVLLEKYKNSKASFYFIKFETLTDFHLRKCIDKELGDTKLDKITYEKFVKKFNVSSDGCKGVQTKVKSLNLL